VSGLCKGSAGRFARARGVTAIICARRSDWPPPLSIREERAGKLGLAAGLSPRRAPLPNEATGALGPSAKALLWRVASNDDAAPDIRSARYRYYICRLSVVLKASAYTMYKRYLTKCVDSLKPPADGE
jgi:hypothetical protein